MKETYVNELVDRIGEAISKYMAEEGLTTVQTDDIDIIEAALEIVDRDWVGR